MKNQKFTWKTLLGLALGIIVYNILKNTVFNFPFQGVDNQKLIDKDWVTITYGKPSISLSTPERLNSFDIGIPKDAVDIIDKMESFSYSNGEKLAILANIVVYNSNAGVANAEGAAEGSIKEMKNKSGVSNFIYQNKNIVVDSSNGIRQDGSFYSNNSKFIFSNVLLAKENVLWQITIINKNDDNSATQIKEKIIQSIKLDKSLDYQ
jgi:hypothetical protein